jgi:gliding motility-associated-like protein
VLKKLRILSLFMFLTLFVSKSGAQTFTVKDTFTFDAQFQSMWGPWPSFNLNTRFDFFRLRLPYSQTTVGGITNVGGFCIGPVCVPNFPFGAEFTIGAGLELGAYFQSSGWSLGDVDVLYPAEIVYTVPSPNTFDKGQPITINSTWNVLEPPAKLTTQFPQTGTLGIYIDFGLQMLLRMQLCAGVCQTITPVNFNFFTTITLFEIAITHVTYPCVLVYPCGSSPLPPCIPSICTEPLLNLPVVIQQPGLGITLSLDIPNVQTTSSVNPVTKCLEASGEYKYIALEINLLVWLSRFAGLLPPPAGPIISNILANFQRTINLPFGGTISWTIFSATFNIDNSMKQYFSYCPRVEATFHLPTLVQWSEIRPNGTIVRTAISSTPYFTVGNNIRINYPCHYEWMDVTVTYEESNDFRNKTYDSISVYFAFKALEFNINIPGVQIIPRICIPPSRICVNVPYPCPTWSNPFRWCTERVCVDPFCVGPLVTPSFNFGFGPLWQATPQVAAIKIPYFDRTWEIQGTVTTTSSGFRLDARDFYVTVTGTDILCHGQKTGSATATVTNGRPPYTFRWSNGTVVTQNSNVHAVNNLAAGTNYVIVFSSDGCEIMDEIYISQPLRKLNVRDIVVTDVSCNNGNNGSIVLDVEGGTPNYNYTWSPAAANNATISNLVASKYYVTITDANSCTLTDSALVKQPYELIATATVTNVNCSAGNDGKIKLAVAGGSPPYSYSWNNNATTRDLDSITAGNYSATVTDRLGCQDIVTATVQQPASGLTISTPVVKDVSCFSGSDGEITVTVAGGTTPYDYRWQYSAGFISANFTNNVVNLSADNYSLKVTDANGCTASQTATVNQPTAIVISSIATNVNCFGNSTGAIDATVTGGTPGYSYSWSVGQNIQDLSNIQAGVYTLVVTDANNCNAQHVKAVTEPNAPLDGFLTKKDVSCNAGFDGELKLTINGGTPGYNYVWSNSQTTEDVDSLTAGNYALTVTDVKGCTLNLNETITEPAPLDISFVTTNVTCYGGNNGSIDATITGGVTPYSLTWSNSVHVVLNHTNPVFNNLKADTYKLKVTDANNCVFEKTAVISQPIQPITTSYTKVDVSCFGGNDGSIDLSVSGGTAPYTYNWSNGTTTQDAANLFAGWHFVTVTDANNCVKTDSMFLNQPLNPLSLQDSIKHVSCFGGNDATIEIKISGGTRPYSYLWSNGNTTTKLVALFAGNYDVTVTDTKNCTLIQTLTVTEPSVLDVTSAVKPVTCNSGNDGGIVLSVTGGTPGYSYRLATSTFIVISDFDSILSNIAAGNYLTTVTDSKGCISQQNISVSQPPIPVTAEIVSLNTVSCFGLSDASITIKGQGGTSPYTYLWNNGVADSSLNNLPAGNYMVTVTDANNCELATTFDVTGPIAPLATNIVSTDIKCFGDQTGTAVLTITGGTPPYQHIWSRGDTSLTLYNLASGPYTITVYDSRGCWIKTGTWVNGPTQPLNITSVTDSVTCFGGKDGSIEVSITGGSTPYQYSWADTLRLFNNNREVLNNIPAGDYVFRVVDHFGCDKSVVIPVYQPAPLSAYFNVSNIKCYGEKTGGIKVLASGGIPPYSFRWNDTVSGPTYTGLYAGNYTVTISDFNNCKLEADTMVSQPQKLKLYLKAQGVSCFALTDAKIDLNVSGGAGQYTYNWSNGATTQDLRNLNSGTYSVSVIDANGCADSTSVFLESSDADCIFIPNSFTPNGDGTNDTWMIKNIHLYPNTVVIVFNKWGNKLFESTKGYTEPWNGTFEGRDLPSDTYYYVIDFGNGKPPANGPITIVR